MADIFFFQPRAELDATANLQGLIYSCKNYLDVFGRGLDFDNPVWDLSETVTRKAIPDDQRVSFCNLKTAKEKKKEKKEWMHEAFQPFAKSYFRYQYAFRPSDSYGHCVIALRVLEAALVEFGVEPDPTRIDATVLNRAAQIAVEHYKPQVAYHIGRHLEEICQFMSENLLLVVPTTWRNPIKRPENPDKIGPEFDERRQAKLPTDAVLRALPQIYLLSKDSVDVLISSIAILLLTAPDRINELLRIPADCEVYMEQQGKNSAYGLRWMTSKGAAHMVKWMIPSLHEFVKEGVAKIKKITQHGRDIAIWYESNPGKIYLPVEFEYLRQLKTFPLNDLVRLFSLRDIPAGKDWCNARKIKMHKENGMLAILFSDFEKTILSMIPRNFPIYDVSTKMKYSEALMTVRENELHSVRAMNPCMFQVISTNMVNYHLGGRVKHGGPSIFTRFGFEEPDGSPIKITTHQLRHYVNTLMQEECVSQLDNAIFSGRKSIQQNDAYNHMTSKAKLALLCKVVGDESKTLGTLTKIPDLIPMSREDYARRRLPTAHVTDIGFCVHDFTQEPCMHYRQCIMCADLVCVKGVDEHAECLRRNLADTRERLRQSEGAVSEDYAGAGRWVEWQSFAVERLEALCAHLDDPRVPEGAVIRVAPPRNSALDGKRHTPCLRQSLSLAARQGV